MGFINNNQCKEFIMFIENNLNLSTYQPTFGYGKGIRELVKSIYPYCALTGKRYASGALRITTDHIHPHHYKGADDDANYIFITKEANSAKKCTGLKKIISKHPEYFSN